MDGGLHVSARPVIASFLFLLAAGFLLPNRTVGSVDGGPGCSVRALHLTAVGVEAEREEFLFLLERELGERGMTVTDDESQADATVRCTVRLTYAAPVYAYATVTVRGIDGKTLWRDYVVRQQGGGDESAMANLAEDTAKRMRLACEKGWRQ